MEGYISTNKDSTTKSKRHSKRYICIPSLKADVFWEHETSSDMPMSPAHPDNSCRRRCDSQSFVTASHRAEVSHFVYEVLPHERLYDLGWKENLRVFARRPIFVFGLKSYLTG